MLETIAVIVASGIVSGLLTYYGIKLHRKYVCWRGRKNWEVAGRKWKYIVDYSTRALVPATPADERKRIEYARSFLNAIDLSAHSDEVDEGFFKTVEYLQDESNPSKLSDVSELQEHKDRIVEIERRADQLRTVLDKPFPLA